MFINSSLSFVPNKALDRLLIKISNIKFKIAKSIFRVQTSLCTVTPHLLKEQKTKFNEIEIIKSKYTNKYNRTLHKFWQDSAGDIQFGAGYVLFVWLRVDEVQGKFLPKTYNQLWTTNINTSCKFSAISVDNQYKLTFYCQLQLNKYNKLQHCHLSTLKRLFNAQRAPALYWAHFIWQWLESISI